MKEEIGLIGIFIIAGVFAVRGDILEALYCVGLAIAYIGGNHNGEKRNNRLGPPL